MSEYETLLSPESTRRFTTAVAEKLGLDPDRVIELRAESGRVDGYVVVTADVLIPSDEFIEMFNTLGLRPTQ